MGADQWLEDGNCNVCRRSKYCSKPCKKNKIATKRKINNMILEATGLNIIKDELRKLGAKSEYSNC